MTVVQPDSDAFATGQTLFALALLGGTDDRETIRKAQMFLLCSQGTDGAWHVSADRVREGDASESLDEIFTYWGSAWATIGLLRSRDSVIE